MQDKPGWPVHTGDQLDLPLRLPPAPKVLRRLADACPKCRCLHTSVESAQACRSMTAQREQL